MIPILYHTGDKQWAWIALYFCLSGQALRETLASGCLALEQWPGLHFHCRVCKKTWTLGDVPRDANGWRSKFQGNPMLHCGQLLQFGSPKDGGVFPFNRGGDDRRIRGDKRQLETSRFRSAEEVGSSLAWEEDIATNQLTPSFVKEQRARTERIREAVTARSPSDDSTAWTGVRDAPAACEPNSESAWTVDTPVAVSTSVSSSSGRRNGDWRVTVELAGELSAHGSSFSSPWNTAGSNYVPSVWPNQYPASGQGGYYGGSSGYNAALPWWNGVSAWEGWRQNGWN